MDDSGCLSRDTVLYISRESHIRCEVCELWILGGRMRKALENPSNHSSVQRKVIRLVSEVRFA
jgi:hypothetical protein